MRRSLRDAYLLHRIICTYPARTVSTSGKKYANYEYKFIYVLERSTSMSLSRYLQNSHMSDNIFCVTLLWNFIEMQNKDAVFTGFILRIGRLIMQAVLYSTIQKLNTSHYAPAYTNKSLNFHFQPSVLDLILLTYLLTPWSRVLLQKLTASAASQEIPRFFGTRRFITVLTSARHLSLS